LAAFALLAYIVTSPEMGVVFNVMLGYVNSSTGTAELNGVRETYTTNDVHARIAQLQGMPNLFAGIDLSIFRAIVNAFYQAEGSLSVSFVNSASSLVSPSMSFTQNVSEARLRFLVMVQRVLGNSGTFRINVTSAGNLHAALVFES